MDELNCMICYNLLCEPITLHCGHSFCRNCTLKLYFKYRKHNCPVCRCKFDNEIPNVNVTLKALIEHLKYDTNLLSNNNDNDLFDSNSYNSNSSNNSNNTLVKNEFNVDEDVLNENSNSTTSSGSSDNSSSSSSTSRSNSNSDIIDLNEIIELRERIVSDYNRNANEQEQNRQQQTRQQQQVQRVIQSNEQSFFMSVLYTFLGIFLLIALKILKRFLR